jgi:hypothetical protein
MKLIFDPLSILRASRDLPSPIGAGDRGHFRRSVTAFSRGGTRHDDGAMYTKAGMAQPSAMAP